MIEIRIKGLDELINKFGYIPSKMRDELDKAIKKSAYLVESFSKPVTPVKTGRLRASIRSEFKPLEARVGPHTDYAFFVHEGTRRMKPRPFMKWGAEKATSKILGVFQDAVKRALN